MVYEDLLAVPFRLNGRDMDGMDCYGICIEMCRRNGKLLKDIGGVHIGEKELPEKAGQVNVEEIGENEARKGDLVQCSWEGEIHIAYMLDRKSVIHATSGGVRVTPIIALCGRRYFRVI